MPGSTSSAAASAAVRLRASTSAISGRQRPAGGPEQLAGRGHARRHCGFAATAPGAWIVRALVADATIDLEHAGVVYEDVVGDRPREGVLGVGVEVDLDHAVGDRGADVLVARAAAAMEDVLEPRPGMGTGERGLSVAEDLRAQLHRARRVDAMNVAERRGEQVAAALARPEHLGDPQQIVRGR